jgi:hypothetical protein
MSTIRRRLKEVREVIEKSPDPIESRVAQAVETAIRWATEDTVGWCSPADDARLMARIIHDELPPNARSLAHSTGTDQ